MNSFIFPLFNVEIDVYSVLELISAAYIRYTPHVGYISVNGANKMRLENSQKNENF